MPVGSAARISSRPPAPAGAIGYVTANRRAIEHYRNVPLASSGPMKKAVDLVVARRFKRRGMSWFRRGVSTLLQLRLLRLNGSWTRYWAERFAAPLRPLAGGLTGTENGMLPQPICGRSMYPIELTP